MTSPEDRIEPDAVLTALLRRDSGQKTSNIGVGRLCLVLCHVRSMTRVTPPQESMPDRPVDDLVGDPFAALDAISAAA